MTVIVVGSANVDTAVTVHRHPGPGETILADGGETGPGGKGLNQAVAAARAGAPTRFVGAVGADAGGASLATVLADEGVDARLAQSPRPTGSAFVMVADGGENAIVVVPGANADAEAIGREARAAIEDSAGRGDVVLAQLEVPVPTVQQAFADARERGAATVLNAAPSRALPQALLDDTDVLIVNQHECRDLAGGATTDVDEAAALLAARGATVVVTLGAAGAVVLSGGTVRRVAAFPVVAVDTTAAGDTFCGALASRIARGDDLAAAVRFASAAAALCVQRRGAAASAPVLREIEELLAGS